MASPSATTSAYFCSMSNRLASMTAGVRSATASRTTMQRMSRMNASVTVARTQPLTLVPQTSNVSMASTPRNTSKSVRKNRLGRDLGDDRRAFAAVDLDSALGMVALLVAPQTGRRTIAGNQALGVEHGQ